VIVEGSASTTPRRLPNCRLFFNQDERYFEIDVILFAGRALRKAASPELVAVSSPRFLRQQTTHGAIFHQDDVLAFRVEAQRCNKESEAMSIFGSIVSAIFGGAKAAGSAVADTVSAATTAVTGGATKAQPMTREQVDAMIQKVADTTGRKDYNWKQSIVDLMKLLNLDSSLASRKQLAQELGYTGALDGSAEMNIWLHKQVMAKLMESGGVVPDSLK
jgi:hypothetical protein